MGKRRYSGARHYGARQHESARHHRRAATETRGSIPERGTTDERQHTSARQHYESAAALRERGSTGARHHICAATQLRGSIHERGTITNEAATNETIRVAAIHKKIIYVCNGWHGRYNRSSKQPRTECKTCVGLSASPYYTLWNSPTRCTTIYSLYLGITKTYWNIKINVTAFGRP